MRRSTPRRLHRLSSRARADLPILLVVVGAMIIGLLTGLARIGYTMPAIVTERVALHGPILAAGVLGTLIALERAVAISAVSGRGLTAAYLAPLSSGLGTVLLLVVGATVPAQLLLALGAAGLLVVNLAMVRRQPSLDVAVMAVGAVFLLVANAAWLAGRPIPLLVHWWIAFLVLTIVGERLELARVRRLGRGAATAFGIAVAVYIGAMVLIAFDADLGIRLSGVAMLALAGWLLRYDIAWMTIHRPGLPRFVAICLLAGYGWLVVGGWLALANGMLWAGPTYDAMLHTLLLGFVFSMIFGHAPIIVPAILGLRIGFHRFAYIPLALLQVSVAMRVLGDVGADVQLRQLGGLLSVVAIILYALTVVVLVIVPRRSSRPRAGRAGPSPRRSTPSDAPER
ncbi:MAG: hypothetical protein R6W93_13590 [Candidatus Limnocylindrales bacterium]